MNWLPLIAEEQLMEVNLLSQKPGVLAVVLLKHSTRCSISSSALNRFERSWKFSEKDVPAYFLDLLRFRDLSNKIESFYEIPHESPQVLIIKNGRCIYSVSHSNIVISDIEAAINSII